MSRFLVGAQKIIPGNTGPRQDGSQSGRLDGRVVWHSETIRAPCPARTPHGNVLSLAHHLEPESVERGDDSRLWGIDRELGQQAGMQRQPFRWETGLRI